MSSTRGTDKLLLRFRSCDDRLGARSWERFFWGRVTLAGSGGAQPLG